MVQDFGSFIARHDEAQAQFFNGNPEPLLGLWSRTEPVSVFGGFGYVSQGWEAVSATNRKASSRFSNGSDYRNQIVISEVHGDVAYTVAVEHCTASVDRAQPAETVLRVTQVYRLEGGEWRLAHRHGDNNVRPDQAVNKNRVRTRTVPSPARSDRVRADRCHGSICGLRLRPR